MRVVDILIAASPNAAFYSQVAVLRLALRRLPWSGWHARLHMFLGGACDRAELARWQPHLGDVTLHWSSKDLYASIGDWAQSDDVFTFDSSGSDIVMAMDADTLPVDTLEPILDQVLRTSAVAGVIAHYPTVLRHALTHETGRITVQPSSPNWPETTVRAAWHRIAAGLVSQPLDFSFSHTLMDVAEPQAARESPFYLNFGVVLFPARVFAQVAPRYLSIRPQLMNRLPAPDFSGQAALTLAIAQARTRTWALPMRYNFPNDSRAADLYPQELEQVVVYHYLRTQRFDRHVIFTTPTAYDAFLHLRLDGVDARFQEAVRRIAGVRYPFA
jgi:hypothetical protein